MDTPILKEKLKGLNGKDYGVYQSLKGEYKFAGYTLKIIQIPKDPYAPPHTGIYSIEVNREDNGVINLPLISTIQETAFKDFLARQFHQCSAAIAKARRGTGNSGLITINQPGQAILDRNCLVVNEKTIQVRCFLGLPAKGRKIDSATAQEMFFEELPKIVENALFTQPFTIDELKKHLDTAEDSEYLRGELDHLGLVAFIADGSTLPRRSGISDQPLDKQTAVRFTSPKSLRVSVDLPNAGTITGMGIPKGVTLIVGGGFHGKSTLLNTLELGCYNHIPEDGREQCVSSAKTVKIRSYNGRQITNTDISPFIKNLPFKKNTTQFSTDNASGSTSQAASIIEAIEVGARVLLMDEDTCATNFMIRDAKMQKLVCKEDEPITPYIDSVKQLYCEKKISTILVLGGVGDYFDVSDNVIQMIEYQAKDVTKKALQISKNMNSIKIPEGDRIPFQVVERIPISDSINPHNSHGKKAIYARELRRLHFGEQTVDLMDLEQLVELSQTKALGYALAYAKKHMNQNATIKEVVDHVINDIEHQGLDILSSHVSGYFAEFRSFELAFIMNRLRSLTVTQKNASPDR